MPESLAVKLNSARHRWRLLQTSRGIGITLTILASMAIVSFWMDRAMALTTAGRMAWLVGLCVSAGLGLAVFLLWPILRPLTDVFVATQVERTYPVLNERLLSTLSLAGAGSAGVSQAMVAQLGRETERIAAPLDFPRAVPVRDAQRALLFAAIATVLIVLHAVLMPLAFNAWLNRILYPSVDIPVYAYTRVWVSPEDRIVPRGDDVSLGVRTEGRAVDRATLRYKFGNGPWAETVLSKPTSDGDSRKFGFKLNDVQQDVTYYAVAGDGQANAHTIHVEDRPALLGVKMKLDYPAYTGRRSEIVNATSSNIVAPVGTHVEIEATANKALESAVCGQAGLPDANWQVHGDHASGAVMVQKDAACELRLIDTRGFKAQQPAQFSIRAQQDQTPTVKIEKPGGDLERTPFGAVNLRVVATDDYGIKDLRMDWQASGRSGGMELPGANGSKQLASGGKWGLTGLKLKGGETVTYEATARDNDDVSGPHIGRSAKYQIHIVSAQEMKERLEGQKEQERDAIKQLVERQRTAQKQLDRAQQDRQPEQTRQAEAVQRQVASETADVARRMQQTSQQMSDNNLATPAEQSKRQATQEELRQLSQKQMPQAAESVKKQDLQNAAQQEQSIKERLEALAQEAGPARSTSQLAQQAEQLAQAQQKAAEQAANTEAKLDGKPMSQASAQQKADLARQAQKQAELNRQTSAMKDQLNQAAKEAGEQGRPEAKALANAAKQMQQSGVQVKQSSAKQQLQSGKPGEASQQQNSAAQDLQNLADKLDQADAGSPEQMNRQADKLENLADRLGEMVNAQRNTASSIGRNPDAQQMQKLAGAEQKIGDKTNQITPELKSYPNVQQQVQNATQNIGTAEQQLNKGAAEPAASVAKEAARQLFQAHQDLKQAAQNMRNAAEAKQAEQEVQKLAQDQMALKKQTQATDESRHGELSQEQQKQVGAEANQQHKLTDRANNLNNTLNSGAMKMIAREVGQKMDNAARNLEQKNTGVDTQRRQTEASQILQRVARSLAQEAKSQQQQAENAGQQSGSQQDMAQAAEDLRLAREMQAQVRQETGGLDERRAKNPERRLSAEQQQELDSIARMQRETEQITQNTAAQLRSAPEMARKVNNAAETMADVHDQMIRRHETGEPTQGQQDKAVNLLDQVIKQQQQQARQQQQQQQQKMAQQGQQQGQQQQQGPPKGSQPNKGFSPVVQQQPSNPHPFDPRGKGFGALDPRTMQSMREGRQEKVPAEYRDLVNQYYKALSEKGR